MVSQRNHDTALILYNVWLEGIQDCTKNNVESVCTKSYLYPKRLSSANISAKSRT